MLDDRLRRKGVVMEADAPAATEAAGAGDVDDRRVRAELVRRGRGQVAEDAVIADRQQRGLPAAELIVAAKADRVDAVVLRDQPPRAGAGV